MAGTESRQTTALVIAAVFLACSTVFVTLRLISRTLVVRKLQPDDWFIIAAWVVSFGLSFSICYGASVGLGRHEIDVPADWEAPLKKSEYAFSVLYNPALMLTKTSILVFYLRLSTTEKIFKWACYATLVVVNVGGLALSILNIAQCRPLSSAFETPIPNGAKCTDIVTLYLSSAPLNIITDLAILFLPFPVLTSIKLPRKQKIILLVTFGFGVFIAVVDVVRIAYLQQAFMTRIESVQTNSHSEGPDARNSSDFSWYGAISYTWSAIEVHVGIMVACVPGLKPLVSRFLPKMLRDSDKEDFTIRSSDASRSMSEMQTAQRIPSATKSPVRDRGESVAPDEGPIGMMDFLTTPDMTELPQIQRTDTTMTPTTPNFFDFVNIQGKKSMVHMTTEESLFPVAMVTVLFFIWGFAYGLLDSLNAQFQNVAHMSIGQTIGIHSAYFAGYFVASASFGHLVLRFWGFKACYIVGLAIYACGTLVFWPAAVLTSFPAFLVSNFIVGMGLSTLEVSANLFISLCGPQEYMEIRLNLSQAVQAIGSVVAPLLATKVLFKSATHASALTDVQWTYLGISLFTILLAVGYYYVPLPEATDRDLIEIGERADGANDAELHIPFFSGPNSYIKVVLITLVIGIFSEFCYVGGQEAISTSFSSYLAEVNPSLDPVNFQAVGHSAFAVSRFIAAGLNLWIKPRYLLAFYYGGAVVFSALCMGTFSAKTSSGLLIMVYFFEGPIFSLVFAMILRGLGRHTKLASAMIVAGFGAGGATIPPIMHAVATGRDERYGWSVIVAIFGGGCILVIWANALPSVRKVLDPVKTASSPSFEGGADTPDEDQPTIASSGSRASRIWGNLKKSRRRKSDEKRSSDDEGPSSPSTEHREKL
ncbi:MFS general substrate transporter [Rhizodiscina lignyota]|uniref:MFS general substrate transporter n=1 Tax=Rhizodiscina lignyota TaxID=1504668 RepID=A0A9P4IEL1_9PEZI|nr:MFS general substrate transporter [Rhizodiscina lignyota]